MLTRLVLLSTLCLASGCCESICYATYSSAIDNCDEWYPRTRQPERNAQCKANAEDSLLVCEIQCEKAEQSPAPTY